MSIIVKDVNYIHPDKDVLFQHIGFSLNSGQKAALIGNNGSGKSTLLNIIAGNLTTPAGEVICSASPYYVPQHFGQYNQLTIAQALQIDKKLKALHAILNGDVSADNFTLLDDDWNIEERSMAALDVWQLGNFNLDKPFRTLSGGEKTKVFLAGIQIHSPSVILMDEPTNHLDHQNRQKLYSFIESTNATLLIVSHDIALLNKLSVIFELSKNKITAYGGNYEFYKEQQEIQITALQASLSEKEKEMRAAKKVAREAAERKQKEDARGKKRNEKKGVPRIMMGGLKDKAEKSSAKLKDIHHDKMSELKEGIKQLQNNLPDNQSMKLNLNPSSLHTGKVLVTAKDVNLSYDDKMLWNHPLSFEIRSGDRLAVKGRNGSGKTTLVKLITGQLQPGEGVLTKADFKYIYIDQEYSIIQSERTLLEQIDTFNTANLKDHELKILLNRFLFPYAVWDKKCKSLSGGEKMRLLLCCLLAGNQAPDMIILDEPTNNLDIQSLEILSNVIKEYQGTMIVISHDHYFFNKIGIEQQIEL
ncbi:MAG: ATP-binding cassette domain-containing protein [Tannerella sp.]|nr:ATP-binding cassette domain-containing protein [Tannerella sp.]